MSAARWEEHFPFVAGLSTDSRRLLGTLAATEVKAGQPLLRRGDLTGGAYLVVGGSLRVYYISEEGREATLYEVERGGTCVLALMSSFTQQPYPAWVEAGSVGGAFVRLPANLLLQLCDSEKGFRQFVFTALSDRVFDLMRTLEETGSARLEQRLARYLLRHRDRHGCVRASQAGIASELGTAREVVFRALRSLAQREIVETGRLRIRVLDQGRLSTLANIDER